MKKSLLITGILVTILFISCLKEDDFKDVVIIGTPELSTTIVDNVKYTTARLGSEVLSNPKWKYKVDERGFVWSKNDKPTYIENEGKSVNSSGFGRFDADIMDLEPNSTYYIRSYAKSGNNIGYGEQAIIKTIFGVLPTVICNVTDVRYSMAKVSGEITATGDKSITERGFVWSTTTGPTYNNNTGKSSNDGGDSVFSEDINNLIPNTKYYITAYAKSEIGVGYSSEVIFTTKSVSYEMVEVAGGTFQMGSGEGGQTPIHDVTLSDYQIGKYEVTQALWEVVMGNNPALFKGKDLPVETVNWNDCQEFINKLNTMTGKNFRLPTEAEWEYAAKGGNKSKGYQYSGSNDINSVAWNADNASEKTHNVGTKASNELGIYDMSGNVREWCNDWYGTYNDKAQTNPAGAVSGSYRVERGGSYSIYDADQCSVAYRHYTKPEHRSNIYGLRLVLAP